MTPSNQPVVVKVGTSSITDDAGLLDEVALTKLADDVSKLRTSGRDVVLVTSAAISGGLPALGLTERPRDSVTLQAASAVGQILLMQRYQRLFADRGIVTGQVLLSPLDFFERQQYLHARGTLQRLLDLGALPIVNENDAVADDAIRFGDNDRIAALVAHLVAADLLVLLTDTPGLLTADPRIEPAASLIEEIAVVDRELEELAGGAGTARGSGGMASKLSAAKIAAWSGVRTVIAAADRPSVLEHAEARVSGVGTVVHSRDKRLSAKRLWIAFAVPSEGRLRVDQGATAALVERGTSLLPVGVVGAEGAFLVGDAVEVCDEAGVTFAKGIVRVNANQMNRMMGRRSNSLAETDPVEVIHRDDLVLMP